jgi:hypothetical protein
MGFFVAERRFEHHQEQICFEPERALIGHVRCSFEHDVDRRPLADPPRRDELGLRAKTLPRLEL